jgi:hypothetical protein
VLRAIMDISARAISLPDRPQWAIWVTSVRIRREDRSSISFSSSRRPRQVRLFSMALRSRNLNLGCLECSTTSQDAPSNASELVGERDGEDVVMQALLGRFKPALEAMAIPALRLDEHNPRGLNEQHPQIAIAALRYLAEDGAVAGRNLLGD